jgi:hypothetical protein
MYIIMYLYVYLITFENVTTNDGFVSHHIKISQTKFITQDLVE